MPEFSMPSWDQMLSGMSKAGVFPTEDTLRAGMAQAKYSKEPVVLTDYRVEVFNMSNKTERDRYAKLMKDLVPKVQAAACVISKNELQVLNGGWWRYVEWFEYALNESSTTKFEPGEVEASAPSGSDDEDDDFGANIY